MGKGAKHLDILTLKMLWQIGEWITQILFTIGLVVSVTALTQGGSPAFNPSPKVCWFGLIEDRTTLVLAVIQTFETYNANNRYKD